MLTIEVANQVTNKHDGSQYLLAHNVQSLCDDNLLWNKASSLRGWAGKCQGDVNGKNKRYKMTSGI